MDYNDKTKIKLNIDYSTFLDNLEQNLIENVTISRYKLSGTYKTGQRFETRLPKKYDAELESLLRKHDVKISSLPFFGFGKIFLLISSILFLLSFLYLAKKSSGIATTSLTKDSLGNFSKNKARLYLPGQIKTNFNSAAGAYEAKEDLKDVVDFLKNPAKYKKMGAKLTRGILLVGEPGNGKTLLAKAVAGEANCPFFYICGSDFLELFVGVGAARIRDLFAQARQLAPCIIFIDEIDAVGRQRDRGFSISHDEREQTLNQLLTEMDGFESADTSVIVLAATNRPDVLDKALLRPGRFDRKVNVPYPDLKSREEVLKVHIKEVPIDSAINLKTIASGTPGFTGADLANLVNLAAINASKNNKSKVEIQDFEEARDMMILGKERKSITLTKKEMEVTAYHEAGHALITLLMPEYLDPLYKVTITPRGDTLGVTHSLPDREKHSVCKEEMEAQVISALGGRAAEEIIFNRLETGAASDFKKATQIVRQMICHFGMSKELGTVVYEQQPGEYKYSEKTAQKIDEETRNYTNECYAKALKLLKENKEKLEQLAQALLKKETLFAQEVYELLKIKPRENHSFTNKELRLAAN